jgi:hypothetical protein
LATVAKKQRGNGVGCGFVLLVFVLIGLIAAYWYVALPLLVVVLVVGLVHRARQRRISEERARHRPGPRDPWLNEVAVALADFELTEFARNTGTQLAGVPIEGDIRLDAPRFSVVVTLLETAELAHQAEIGLRAKPEVRAAVADGKSVIRTEGRVLYTANGRGRVVDEARLNEVVQIVDGIPVGPPRVPPDAFGPHPSLPPAPPAWPPPPPSHPDLVKTSSPAGVPAPGTFRGTADVLDQIKRLAELRDTGVLTDEEFDAKKAELLRRL